jgi:hypothetical protein
VWVAVTSEAKIAANRRNAQRSTGPRTASAKMRVRRNAVRHGLAALIIKDRLIPAEVDQLATAIFSTDAVAVNREQALVIAECEVALRRVRAARVQLLEQMILLSQKRGPEVSRPIPKQGMHNYPSCLKQLLRLDRYEGRALARRKRAMRAIFSC